VTPAFRAREQLLQSIADRIKDYRQVEILPRTPGDVDRWVRQFSEPAQQSILAEMDHVLSRVYISRQACEKALARIVISEKLALPSPGEFWRKVNFLRIQDKGESQRVMLSLFDEALKKETGLTLTQCGSPDGPYFYLDDCVFTGTHVRWDIIAWVKTDHAPKVAKVHILTLANHRGRIRYTKNKIQEGARGVNKDITAEKWWRFWELADFSCSGETDCLHPASFPQDNPHVQRLLTALAQHGYPATARTIPTTAANKVFSSEAGRGVLEQEFFKAGAKIKYELCPDLRENHWPLGYDVFKCVGFGSLLVTYRNCPNNCPLVLWAGDPWFPLFPRKTNTQSAVDILCPDDGWLEELFRSAPSRKQDGSKGVNKDNEEIPFSTERTEHGQDG
jgi:hypothetical protein